jgi:hypothetical protein
VAERHIRLDTTIGGDAMSFKPPTSLSGRATLTAGAIAVLSALVVASGGVAASSGACSFCGKNLVQNPGAEAGRGLTSIDSNGAVPGWTKTTPGFGAAQYGAPAFAFNATSPGPKDRGKNYFFGAAMSATVTSIGTQTIKLPATAAGHKATLSAWLGNYSSDRAEVRAIFMDSSGKMLSAVRIGPDTTIAGFTMALRARTAVVPKGATTANIVITFSDLINNSNGAGADDISLVLT